MVILIKMKFGGICVMNCGTKSRFLWIAIILLCAVIGAVAYYAYQTQERYAITQTNKYNESFGNLVNYMNSVESLLAKAMISKDAEHSAETLTEVWRDSNLALVYLAGIPMNTEELSGTAKFLNQVSDYSYSLSRKNIKDEELSDEDFNNLKTLHQYSIQLENTLNQLSEELYANKINWDELTKNKSLEYAQAVDNVSMFSNIDANFTQYEGLIYDGAYSDHVNKADKVGLTGDEISEEEAYQKVRDFFGGERIEKINLNQFLENANIPCYDFSVKLKNQQNECNIEIAKKGGWVIEMQNNREVSQEIISQEEANEKGKTFLAEKGFPSMKETYFTKLNQVVTVNYAYENNGIMAYPDLIKVKIALDNGEILGMETTGYLNSHTSRDFDNVNFSIEEAKENLNENLEIMDEGLAIIPTEWKTELLCYEFKGKVEDREFLVYINVETGEEEDILVILDTPGGTLTV